MLSRCLAGVAILLTGLACGASSSTNLPSGPTAATVAIQSGDLPSGMQKCSLSGDIDTFLSKSKITDPNTYSSTKSEWDAAKKSGAIAAYTAFYTDTTAHCSSIGSSSSDFSSATFKLVVNFVVQFKDEQSASKGYTSESIFGFSATSLKSGGAPVTEGTKTGLGPNSIELSVPVSNQSFYVAVWQNKVFMVILAILNVDPATSKKAAVAENSRIK